MSQIFKLDVRTAVELVVIRDFDFGDNETAVSAQQKENHVDS